MKGKTKCLSFSVIFIILFIILSCFPVYAEEYGSQYPDYVNQSGACFIECNTNLGKGSIVFAKNYQENTIGFYGSGHNIMNITSGSVSGYLVLENGNTYNVRAQGFSTFQYYDGSNWGNYYDLTTSQITNTNVQFVDDQKDRANTIYEFSNFEIMLLSLIFLFIIVVIISSYFVMRCH